MALSGYISTNLYNSKIGLKFSWTATQQVANNTSTVSWTLSSTGGSTTSWWMAAPITLTINGSTALSITTRFKLYGGGAWSRTGSLVVNHNSLGEGVVNVSVSAAIYDSSVNCTASNVFSLDTIARASELSVSNGTLSTAMTISADRKNSIFTHTLSWVAGNYSGTICTKSDATSWSFTPPLTLANSAPNGTNVQIKFTLQTYSGDSLIGSASETVLLAIPASVKPSCTISISDPEGHVATYGGYIQGQTQIGYTVTPTIAYGSPISSYKVDFGRALYTDASGTIDSYSFPGDIDITATVTDRRSRSGSCSTSINVLEYEKPKISLLKVHRSSSSNGTEDQTGDFVVITYSYNITSLSSKNSKSITLEYKKTSETVWTTSTWTPDDYMATEATYIIEATGDSSYDIRITVSDDFSQTVRNTSVSTAYCIFHVPASGQGITFGGVAESDGFNVCMPSHFIGGFTEDIQVLTSVDCNTIKTSGHYYIGTTSTNRPETTNGWLNVKSYSSGAFCYQEYITYTGLRFYRICQNGTWESWISLDRYTSGTWTPVCASISSPTQAVGYYTKIDDYCTISFCIYGDSTSSSTASNSLRITGLPFDPDTSVRWYGGGGNISGVKTNANYSFSGYVIENDSTYGAVILPRCVAVTTSAATRTSGYCINVSGGTMYMSGTIMYKVA